MGVFGKIVPQMIGSVSSVYTKVRDLFIHALFARVALKDGRTVEFRTVYNDCTNTIELDIPDDLLPVLDEVMGMQRGEKFQAYINWLIGRQAIIDDVPAVVVGFDTDQQFVPVGSLTIWTGATVETTDNNVSIALPTVAHSVIGYSMKLSSAVSGNTMKVSLVWRYDAGVNTSYDIRSTITSSDFNGALNVSDSNDTNISTFNLVKGDVRATELILSSGFLPDEMINIVIQRNYDGSPEGQTEAVNVLGIKVEVL